MESARARSNVKPTSRLFRLPDVRTAEMLKAGFAVSLGAYLLLKLVGIIWHLTPLVDLTLLPAGVCAVGLALRSRAAGAVADTAAEAEESIRAGILAGAVLLVFTITYLAVNTVPVVTSQDETAIVNGGRALATNGSLRVTSPLNDQYDTNIIGALHVMYRTPTEMYYRTFPGTAALYAPFALLPNEAGFRFFTATFGTLAIVALYLVGRRLLGSWWGGFAAALTFAVSPVFGHWAVTVFNNVPVLSLELSALAVVLWVRRGSVWGFGLAGILLSVAFFARVTEVVYVLPLLVLVCWRARALRPVLAFAGACAVGVLLVAATNQLFYGDALFLPQVGSGYLPPHTQSTVVQPESAQTLLGRYTEFTASPEGSESTSDKLHHTWFHVRYITSSTFAFPFLAIAFAGLAWLVAAQRRGRWILLGAVLVAFAVVLGLYGQGSSNYYGYGQSIVRASFVRYSLPIYALLAIAAGAFFVEGRRLVSNARLAAMLPVVLLAVVGAVGVAQSYDARVYGFNRLNGFRESDQAAWRAVKARLDTEAVTPLVIGGPTSEKLIDSDYELSFINYTAVPPEFGSDPIISVARQAADDRGVYLITSDGSQEDRQWQTTFYLWFRPESVLHVNGFRLHRVHFAQASYRILYVDVWNTYEAFNRWAITPDGFLKSVGDNSYVQLPSAVDADRDGRIDQDVTLQFEVADAGPTLATISGLDSRGGWQPMTLWSAQLGQTGEWHIATVVLRQGEYLKDQIIVSQGVTLRSLGIVSFGPK